jgi:hypothetical protein
MTEIGRSLLVRGQNDTPHLIDRTRRVIRDIRGVDDAPQ